MTENNRIQSHTAPQSAHHREWGGFLLHRWPTVLGIAIAFITAFDEQLDRGFVASIVAFTIVFPLVYLGATVLQRQSSAWLVLLAGLVLIVLPRLFALPTAAPFLLLGVALVFLVIGLLRKQWQPTDSLPLQTAGMIGFSALALGALYVDLTWAGYLLAVALLGHAAWDAVHWWRNHVVARSYAEFCAVVDLLLGVAILVML